jgi:glycosyltransferase involved in cell wall biosynthesis
MATAKKIVLITPGQPSSNPRLVKEAVALYEAGYAVTVVYNFWVLWADKGDRILQKQYPQINWICTGGHPQHNRRTYLFTRTKYKLHRIIAGFFSHSLYWQERAELRCYAELRNTTAAIKADLYIAHNLGALPAAAKAAKKNKSKFSFDAEDYHRGQVQPASVEFRRSVLIENKYLPSVSYCSAASPLIAKQYAGHYPSIQPTVINNVFSKQYLQVPVVSYKKGEQLRLFWFSQTVGFDRGLEELIQAIGAVKHLPISCTILGSCTEDMKNYLLQIAATAFVNNEQLHFVDPVAHNKIFDITATQHIGLALEVSTNLNRQICLTNKIFTYLLGGLAIAATDTAAQKQFLLDNPGIGNVYTSGKPEMLADILQHWYDHPEELNACRVKASQLAESVFNWEAEQQSFLQLVRTSIKN